MIKQIKRQTGIFMEVYVMYKTVLIEGITAENVTEKINEKVTEMEKESYQIKTMSFLGTEKAVLVFKKGLKGSLL